MIEAFITLGFFVDMSESNPDFCFCTLALGSPYRLMTKELAQNLKTYAQGTYLVVGTDAPEDFSDNDNVLAFKHRQQSLLHCYNDKRIIIEKSLEKFNSAIYIDADTRIIKPLPENISFTPGITSCYTNLIKHVSKYRPYDLDSILKVSKKLDINVSISNWAGDSLFVITKDQGKEKEFLKLWQRLASYLELRGMNSGVGNVMGLAATKVGWTVKQEQIWTEIRDCTQHLDASKKQKKRGYWKIGYYFRLAKMRLATLKDIEFYYF